MWAIATVFHEGDRVYYTGCNGQWSSDRVRAARWIDRRDAWIAIKENGYVGRAETVWLDRQNDRERPSPSQYIPEEVLATAPSARNLKHD